MSLYYPEGWRIDTPQNRNAMLSYSTLADACRDGQILEGRAIICDSAHNLMVDLGCMKGIIPPGRQRHWNPGRHRPGHCHYFPCK